MVMYAGLMTEKISFAEWVAEREVAGESKAAIAAGLQIKIASLYRYLDASRVPDREVMRRILSASDGRVDAGRFYTGQAA
jgi:hypothetical protein